MRVSKAGVYVMIKSYGIEGFLSEEQTITIDSDKEEALINSSVLLRPFDTIMLEIVAQSVEFRR